MKRIILFAVTVALVCGTAFAQQEMVKKTNAGATFTTGVVVSIDKTKLTIRDDANQIVSILIAPETVGATHHGVGSRVRVNVHRNDENLAVADEILVVDSDTETAVDTEGVQVPATYNESKPTTKMTVTTPEPEYGPEPNTDSTSSLPQTASPLAAIGLLGLIFVGGAMAIRFGS